MRTFRTLLAGLLAASALAMPCAAAIGTPVSLGTINTSGNPIASITSSAGQLIEVFILTGTSVTTLSCGDSAANIYTTAVVLANNVNIGKVWECHSTNPASAMTGTGTITATTSPASSSQAMVAMQISGLDLSTPLDQTATFQTGGSGTVVSPAVTLTTTHPTEIAIAPTIINGTATGYTVDVGDGFVNVNSAQITAGSKFISVEYKKLSVVSSPSNAPTWSSSHGWGASMLSFTAPNGGVCELALLGVGRC